MKKEFFPVRSHYVYENKGKIDRMSEKFSDIFGNMTRFLQKITDFDSQFAVKGIFLACFFAEIYGDDSYLLASPSAGGTRMLVPK